MCSRGISFVPAAVTHAVLDISPDSVYASIIEVTCRAYILLTCSAYRTLNCSSNWLQASFTAQELGAYLEGTIRTWCNTPAQPPVVVTFQGRNTVAYL